MPISEDEYDSHQMAHEATMQQSMSKADLRKVSEHNLKSHIFLISCNLKMKICNDNIKFYRRTNR